MRARPEIRDLLLLERMKKWLNIALMPSLDKHVTVGYARKRYWALVRAHRTVAAKAGLDERTILESGPLR